MSHLTVSPIVYTVSPNEKLIVTYTTDAFVANVMLTMDNGSTFIPCESFTQTQATFDISGYSSKIYEECFIQGEVQIAVESIKLSPNNITIASLDTVTITPQVLPENAYNKNITWSSTNPRIATVDNGVVTPLRSGNTTITCKSVSNPSVSETCAVVVDLTGIRIPCQSITLDKSTITITDSMPVELTATLTPDNTSDEITWTASPTGIVTLNKTSDGNKYIVTPQQTGSCTVTATCNDKSATCNVAIEGLVLKPCTGLEINPITTSIKLSETVTISASVTPSDTTDALIWTSSNNNIATVDNGVVTPVAVGDCTITATCGSYSQQCSLTVRANVRDGAIAWGTGTNYSWEVLNHPNAETDDSCYPFTLESDGYIKSGNAGHDYTYSLCILYVTAYEDLGLIINTIVSGEQGYDYAIFGKVDQELIADSEYDEDFMYANIAQGEVNTNVTCNMDAGEHQIWIKYVKDSSNSEYDDCLKFKVTGSKEKSNIPDDAIDSGSGDGYYYYVQNLNVNDPDIYDFNFTGDSIRSSNDNMNDTSSICKVVFENERPVNVTFWVSVSSEESWDKLCFSPLNTPYTTHNEDDPVENTYTGTVSEAFCEYSLPAGHNEIYVKYSKDGSGNAGNDAGYFLVYSVVSQ